MKNHKPDVATVLSHLSSPAVWLLLLLLWTPVAGVFAEEAGISAQEEVPEDSGKTALGRNLFKTYCASCHGLQARGDGSLAEYLRVAPADLTRLSVENDGEFPFEEVRKQVDRREIAGGHGSDMPVWGDAFEKAGDDPDQVETKIVSLVHFLRSVQETVEEGR